MSAAVGAPVVVPSVTAPVVAPVIALAVAPMAAPLGAILAAVPPGAIPVATHARTSSLFVHNPVSYAHIQESPSCLEFITFHQTMSWRTWDWSGIPPYIASSVCDARFPSQRPMLLAISSRNTTLGESTSISKSGRSTAEACPSTLFRFSRRLWDPLSSVSTSVMVSHAGYKPMKDLLVTTPSPISAQCRSTS